MDITGFDNIIFSCRSIADIVSESMADVFDVWPNVSIDFFESGSRISYLGVDAPKLLEQSIGSKNEFEAYIYCEPWLRDHFENHGYTVTNDGVGPFAIYCRNRTHVVFKISKLAELYSEEAGEIGPPEPYSALVASPQLTEITVVTPGSVNDNGFSRKILSLFSNHCLLAPASTSEEKNKWQTICRSIESRLPHSEEN